MELIKLPCITQEKLAIARRELQEIVALTSKLTTQVGIILTSKTDHFFSSFGITVFHFYADKLKPIWLAKFTP